MKQILNILAASRTLNVRNGRFGASWGHAMRNIAAIASAALLSAGCSTYAADRYAISMDSQTELKQIAVSSQGQGISVDKFTATEPGQTEIGFSMCLLFMPGEEPRNRIRPRGHSSNRMPTSI